MSAHVYRNNVMLPDVFLFVLHDKTSAVFSIYVFMICCLSKKVKCDVGLGVEAERGRGGGGKAADRVGARKARPRGEPGGTWAWR